MGFFSQGGEAAIRREKRGKDPFMADQPGSDDIANIMNEIETLQQSMNDASSQGAASADPTSGTDPNALDDIIGGGGGGGGEASLEETMASIKGDPSQKTLFDEEEAAVAAEASEASPEMTEEELEREIEAQVAEASKTVSADPAEAEIMAEIERETAKVVPMPTRSKNHSHGQAQGQAEGQSQGQAMTLRVSGSMRVDLAFDAEGQEVRVCVEQNSLHITLSDGLEFKIPLNRGSSASAKGSDARKKTG